MDTVACHLGRVGYHEAWALQRQLQTRLIVAKRDVSPAQLNNLLLLLEHPPVYTLGKSGNREHLLLSEKMLSERGAEFVQVDRGGDITFHGPGQLVGYPILDLDHFFTDIHRYLRELEETIILTCADYGLTAGRYAGRTGVWIGPDEKGRERKICAMGIRCSRWVTMHGFAFNVNTDLGWFDHIIPCGIQDRGVTSLARELGRPVDQSEVASCYLGHFADRFSTAINSLHGAEARTYLDAFLQLTLDEQVSDLSQ